jgi:hypothetical protein
VNTHHQHESLTHHLCCSFATLFALSSSCSISSAVW